MMRRRFPKPMTRHFDKGILIVAVVVMLDGGQVVLFSRRAAGRHGRDFCPWRARQSANRSDTLFEAFSGFVGRKLLHQQRRCLRVIKSLPVGAWNAIKHREHAHPRGITAAPVIAKVLPRFS